MFRKVSILFLLLFFGIAANEESFPELEKEIKDLQKKIRSTKDNIKKVKKKVAADKKSFSSYENQQDRYFNRHQAELDSLKNDYSRLNSKTDSLAGDIQQTKNRQLELDLLQKKFTRLLLNACSEFKEILAKLPLKMVHNQISALEFLRSELSVHAVDNVEALERLWQIHNALSEGGQSVDVAPGQSPVPFIKGQVHFIRLGFAYCAIVNEKGSAGALWVPSADSTGGKWVEHSDPQNLLALKKCVGIRQGNAVPEIVGIPFQHPVKDDSPSEEGGDK